MKVDKISAAGGGEVAVPRLPAIHFNPPGSTSGAFLTPAVNGLAGATVAAAANRLDLFPVRFDRDTVIDEVALEVTAGVASSLARVGIYTASPLGSPSAFIMGTTDMDCATTGAKALALAFTFRAGVTYWLAVLTSSTQTLRGIALGNAFSLGISATGGTHNTLRRATQTYASGFPSTAPVSTLTSSILPLVRLRLA